MEIMEMVVNAFLIAGAGSAAMYCRVLAKRLSALKDPASGLGAAITTLSRQVDVLRNSIEQARVASGEQTRSLTQVTARAAIASGRLELLLAALHENGRERPIDKKQVELARRVRAETMVEAMVEARAEVRAEVRAGAEPNNRPDIRTPHTARCEPQKQAQPQKAQPQKAQPQDRADAKPDDRPDDKTGDFSDGRLSGITKARGCYTDEMSDRISWGAAP